MIVVEVGVHFLGPPCIASLFKRSFSYNYKCVPIITEYMCILPTMTAVAGVGFLAAFNYVLVCFSPTRYLKPMQLGSPNFTHKWSMMSPGNPLILGSKGQRSRTRGTKTSLCRSSDGTQYCRLVRTYATLGCVAWWLSGRALNLRFTGRGCNSRLVRFHIT